MGHLGHQLRDNPRVTFDWSPWRPLATCWSDRELACPGLYRIRRPQRSDIDYIGQLANHSVPVSGC
jgi:hypothetical protein